MALADIPNRISIHAPRVGSDYSNAAFSKILEKFQSTLPVWGATGGQSPFPSFGWKFQSTLPVWGATGIVHAHFKHSAHFNPRSPCGERRAAPCSRHSPQGYFNPRSPCGERRRVYAEAIAVYGISIHAPRVGSDCPAGAVRRADRDFNPRSPCGERHTESYEVYEAIPFQSTLPVWGATVHMMRRKCPG